MGRSLIESSVRMTDWVKANFSLANLLTIIVIVGGIVAAWARAEYRDSYHDKMLSDNQAQLRQHLGDRDIHVDPRRDDQRWDDLLARLRSIETKLDGRRNER